MWLYQETIIKTPVQVTIDGNNNYDYVYMAFAEHPFKHTNAR